MEFLGIRFLTILIQYMFLFFIQYWISLFISPSICILLFCWIYFIRCVQLRIDFRDPIRLNHHLFWFWVWIGILWLWFQILQLILFLPASRIKSILSYLSDFIHFLYPLHYTFYYRPHILKSSQLHCFSNLLWIW